MLYKKLSIGCNFEFVKIQKLRNILLFLRTMTKISEKYYSQFCNYLQNNVSFVAYRLPETEEIRVFVADSVERFIFSGQDDIFAQEGFLIVPFDNENQWAYLLRTSCHCGLDPQSPEQNEGILKQVQNDRHIKENYCSSFNKIHTAIENGEISKAVLSRQHEIKNVSVETAVACFLHLCEQENSDYNYLLHLPGEVGVWVGASPELFLKKDGQTIETVSLAGTMPAKQSVFSEKEKEEQEIVSDYVSEVLADFGIKNPVQNESISVSGNIAHLKTAFCFPKNELTNGLGKLLEALHPTPAVCGYPKMASKRLILNTENHNRSLYSGFLGKVENDGQCALFVNIRSVQFAENKAIVYVGGGITDKSDAQSEWNETELKLQNILSMFNLSEQRLLDKRTKTLSKRLFSNV